MGKFTRSIDTVKQDAEAAELRSKGWSYRQIARHFGWSSHKSAQEAIQRAIDSICREPAESAVRFELDRMDAQLLSLEASEREMRKVLEEDHYVLEDGQPVYVEGRPVRDDRPWARAVDRLNKIQEIRLRISESRRRLLGLDAEKKLAVSGGVHYKLVGVDPEKSR